MFFGMGKAIVLFLRNRYFSSTHTLELLISKAKGPTLQILLRGALLLVIIIFFTYFRR